VPRRAGAAHLERAGAGEIAFFSNPRYRSRLRATRAAAVILSAEAESLTAVPRIVCDNPYAYYARVSQLLNPSPAVVACVDPAAHVHPEARVAGSAVLERAIVGRGSVIEKRASVRRSVLWDAVVVEAGARVEASILASGVRIAAGEGVVGEVVTKAHRRKL